MTRTTTDPIVRFSVTSREELDHALDRAVKILQDKVMQSGSGSGLLITRNTPHEFTIETSKHVPFGETRERYEW